VGVCVAHALGLVFRLKYVGLMSTFFASFGANRNTILNTAEMRRECKNA